jgi:hypothetical protein
VLGIIEEPVAIENIEKRDEEVTFKELGICIENEPKITGYTYYYYIDTIRLPPFCLSLFSFSIYYYYYYYY